MGSWERMAAGSESSNRAVRVCCRMAARTAFFISMRGPQAHVKLKTPSRQVAGRPSIAGRVSQITCGNGIRVFAFEHGVGVLFSYVCFETLHRRHRSHRRYVKLLFADGTTHDANVFPGNRSRKASVNVWSFCDISAPYGLVTTTVQWTDENRRYAQDLVNESNGVLRQLRCEVKAGSGVWRERDSPEIVGSLILLDKFNSVSRNSLCGG